MSESRSQLRSVRFSRSDPGFVPLCAAAVLVTAVVLQLVLPAATVPDELAHAPHLAAMPPAEMPADYPAIVAAPIFAPDRKPDPNDVSTPNAAQEMVLLGVANEGSKFVALMKGADGSIQRVLPGGTIDGWRLSAATPSQVTLERNGQQRTMPLTPGEARKVAAAPADAPAGVKDEDEDDSQ